MAAYEVRHVNSGQTFSRPKVFSNPHHHARSFQRTEIDPAIEAFHRTLPDYGETKLHSLPSVAEELGFGHVLMKDEGTRFGLPSFKIAGASWAIHQVLCRELRVSTSQPPSAVAKSTHLIQGLTLVTCSDGNWGRAVARMAKINRINAKVFVPGFVNEYTRNLIRSEGAEVVVCEKLDYDNALAAARAEADNADGVFVADMSFDDYVEVPSWVTDGYSTIMVETDRQVAELTGGKPADIVTCSVGVGSWAHSVVEHYAGKDHTATLVSVEPDTAAGLKESLHTDAITSVETGDSIMCGMNCGTTSKIAWPVLRAGVTTSVAVTDKEAHESVTELRKLGIDAGPCGAANLAALRAMCAEGLVTLDRDSRKGKVVVLFSTEGGREYEVPT